MKKTIYTMAASAVLMLGTGAKAQTISTYAGDYTKVHTFSGDGSAATAAGLDGPTTCVFDAAGNFYFSDKYNGSIRMVNSAGIISTFAGTGAPGTSGDGGPATAAQIDWPIGINFDRAGNLYIAAYNSHTIRKVNTAGNISTFAGRTGVGGFAGDGDAATAAKISYPTDVAADAAGNIYISDWNNGLVRKVNTVDTISTYAGGGSSYTDGCPATDASFYGNNSVFSDHSGNLFVADMNDNRICKISSGALCYTITGDGTAGYTGDGAAATAARCDGPAYITMDVAGNLFFADHYNHVIRRIEASTGNITTVVGSNVSGYSGDGGAATAAKLQYPVGICFNTTGDMFICDQGNGVVRKVTAAAVAITGTTTICRGNTSTLTPVSTGGVWSSSNTAVATVSSTGVVTGVGPGTATIAYAMGLGYGSSVVTVNNCPTETLVPADKEFSLSVFPNPVANGQFAVNMHSQKREPVNITITNILGNPVKIINGMTNEVKTITADMPDGIYFLSATTESGKYTTKLVVQ